MIRRLAVFLILLPLGATCADNDQIFRIGKGISPPRLLHKVEPVYSREAQADRIEGLALYSLVVDKNGKPRDIELVSPIGHGLDEKGLEAIRQWLFQPGEKDGMPVNIRATVEVTFRFAGSAFDAKTEQRRTDYNAALHSLAASPNQTNAIAKIQELAGLNYPPAMSLRGEWMIDGINEPKDPAGGAELVKKAADKNDPNGLYVLGMLYLRGQGLPIDPAKGSRLIRDASTHGSQEAQIYLGAAYEKGDVNTAADPERARYYYRLCAAKGNASCQLHLGRLLMPVSGGPNGDPVQALAWLQLAEQGSERTATPLIRSLQQTLSDSDQQTAAKLMTQLIRR